MPKIRVTQDLRTTPEGRLARTWAYHCPTCNIMRIHDEAVPWQAVLAIARDHARTCPSMYVRRRHIYLWGTK